MTTQDTDIPEGWTETTLGEIIKIIGGGTPKTTIDTYWNGSIPWLSVVDFNSDNRWVSKTEKTITEEGLLNSSTKLLNAGDIIISARGTVGAVAQLKSAMTFNQSCYGIQEIEGLSDKDYLYYLIKFEVKQISKNVHGAVFDTITRDTFYSINILLPSLSEQKEIAAILSGFDNKIELLRTQNETLEKTAQTIFQEWFGKYSVDDDLPEGWRFGKLGEISEITSGKRPGEISDSMTNTHNIPLLGASKIMGYVESHLFDGKTLVIGRVGTHGEIQKFNEKIYPSDNTLVLKSDNFVFVYLILKNIDYEKINRGAVQPLITQTDMKNYPVIIPLQEIFNSFKDTTDAVFDKIENNNSQIQSLSKIRDELLPRLMSGEVRVV